MIKFITEKNSQVSSLMSDVQNIKCSSESLFCYMSFFSPLSSGDEGTLRTAGSIIALIIIVFS